MTDTKAPPVEPAGPVGRRSRAILIIVLLAVLLVAGVTTGVLLSRGSNDALSSQQLTNLQYACAQWEASSPAAAAPSDWCTNMVAWMSDRTDDHPGMWTSPEAMQATCRDWSAANPSGTSRDDRIAWCNDMVSWMQHYAAHWGSWGGWMMHGPMMG